MYLELTLCLSNSLATLLEIPMLSRSCMLMHAFDIIYFVHVYCTNRCHIDSSLVHISSIYFLIRYSLIVNCHMWVKCFSLVSIGTPLSQAEPLISMLFPQLLKLVESSIQVFIFILSLHLVYQLFDPQDLVATLD